MSTIYQQQIEVQLQFIVQAMKKFPQGATIEEITSGAGLAIELRTF